MNGFSVGILGGLLGALILDMMSERDSASDGGSSPSATKPVKFQKDEVAVAVETSPGNFQVILSAEALKANDGE